MKPTKNFKMPKRTKTLAALLQHKDPSMGRSFMDMMIQAHLASGVRAPSERSSA